VAGRLDARGHKGEGLGGRAALRIEDYIATLPKGIVSGDGVQLPARALRRMLGLAGIRRGEAFMHLGCGDGEGLRIALEEFGAGSAVGVDTSAAAVATARESLPGDRCEVVCGDAVDADVSGADVVAYWFADEAITAPLRRTLSSLREGARVVSVWGPPAGCLPERIDFPFVLSVAPFREAKSVREQLLAVLGVRCVDFVTAWEYSERYTRAIGPDGNEGNRFLTMMQAVTMWIGARNLGVSCTSEMPESIRTYAGILRTFYGIEVEHLLEGGGESQPGPRGAAHAQ